MGVVCVIKIFFFCGYCFGKIGGCDKNNFFIDINCAIILRLRISGIWYTLELNRMHRNGSI